MNNSNKKQPKKDITLMTLLAYESTADARRLLKKHNLPDAKSYADLEIKLCELYYATPDENKKELEKEFAEIHPHKKWILRNTNHKNCDCDECKKNRAQKESATPIQPPTISQIDSLKSSAEGPSVSNSNENIHLHYIGAVSLVAVILGITAFGVYLVKK
jgi:hypothetical protein